MNPFQDIFDAQKSWSSIGTSSRTTQLNSNPKAADRCSATRSPWTSERVAPAMPPLKEKTMTMMRAIRAESFTGVRWP
jgi:hypothetical protein